MFSCSSLPLSKITKNRTNFLNILSGLFVAVLYSALTLFSPGIAMAQEEDLKPPKEQPAKAQEEAPVDTRRQEAFQLPAVTVTADKRATDVQRTPMAITVITQETIEDAGIDTIQEVMSRVPNLNFSPFPGGMNDMSFRGIITSPGTSTSPVIMYIDGVPVDTYFNLEANLLDVERVEVLRGPQSTMYGKNAKGGVINIISKKPDNTIRGKVAASYGEHNTQKYSATLSGPLAEDKLFMSLAAMHSSTDGYMHNVNNGKSNNGHRENVKGQLRFTPTEKTEFNLYVDFTAVRDGYTNAIFGSRPTFNTTSNPDDHFDSNILNLALHASTDFDIMVAESITTFRDEDLDATAAMEFLMPETFEFWDAGREGTRREFTQELRLKSPDKTSGVAWLAGLYGAYTEMDFQRIFSDAKAPNYFFGSDYYFKQNQPSVERTTDLAAFGEATVPITDKFRVTGGLRWQYTEKNINLTNDKVQNVPDLNWTQVDYMNATQKNDWNALMPKLTFSYDVAGNVMLYTGVNRIYTPGGFNNVSETPTNFEYKPEKGWSYELGAKSNWLDNRLNTNLTFFYSTLEDMQIRQFDAVTGTYLADNAGSSTIYGTELEITARILPGLDLETSFGYTHAKFDDFEQVDSAGVTRDHSGNWVPYTPRYTGNIALQYRHESGIFARAETQTFGRIYWENDNQDYRSSITIFNARVGYELEDLGMYVYGNNLFNKEYLSNYYATSQIGMMAAPREVGVQLQYKF